MHIASGRLSRGNVGNASMITQSDDFPPFSLSTARGIETMDTQAAAEALASRIVHAWAREGHKVTAWVIRSIGTQNNPPTWSVRTDLVNGMPSGLGRYSWEVKYGRVGV
jgi:hypothetical protein